MKSAIFSMFFVLVALSGVLGQTEELATGKKDQIAKQGFMDTLDRQPFQETRSENVDEATQITGNDLAIVKVFRLNGQLIKNLSLKTTDEICQIEGLLKGSYWVTFSKGESLTATRLVID